MTHIIYVVDDGISSLRCGVGAIARHFIRAYPEIARDFLEHEVQLKFSVIAIRPHKNSVGLRPDYLRETEAIAQASGGAVHLIAPKIAPQANYFNFTAWRQYNEEINNMIDHLTARSNERAVIIANDVIFAHVYGSRKHVTNIWIPHSLSGSHDQSYVSSQERIAWEQEAFRRIGEAPRSFVGYISPSIKKILHDTFRVPDHKLIAYRNGFHLPELGKYAYEDQTVLRTLDARRIPTNKSLIFSFGRADEYKGLDISLKAMIKITKDRPDYHGVLVASRFSQETFINELQAKLQHIHASAKDRVSLFLGYEFELPKYILRHQGTKFLLNLPTRDFCPLVPFEAQLIGHNDLCVVNSDIFCFKDTVRDDEDGFLCAAEVDATVDRVNKILTIPKNKRKEIVYRGRANAKRDYDIKLNYISGLRKTLE